MCNEHPTPVIYIDDQGELKSRVSAEQVEAVLGPHVDRIRKEMNARGGPRADIQAYFEQQKQAERDLHKNMLITQIRNAIVCIEDGDETEAVAILKQLIGEPVDEEEDPH